MSPEIPSDAEKDDVNGCNNSKSRFVEMNEVHEG